MKISIRSVLLKIVLPEIDNGIESLIDIIKFFIPFFLGLLINSINKVIVIYLLDIFIITFVCDITIHNPNCFISEKVFVTIILKISVIKR